MSKSCGSCQWYQQWKDEPGQGLCVAIDARTSAKNKITKECTYFKQGKNIKQRKSNLKY